MEGLTTIERKAKLSRKEKREQARKEKEKKKLEKLEKQKEKKEKKEQEKKEKQEKKEREKAEKEQKEKEKKEQKLKEKEAKRQKSKERSKSRDKSQTREESESTKTPHSSNSSEKRTGSPSPPRHDSKLEKSSSPNRSANNNRSNTPLCSPKSDRSRPRTKFKEHPKVGESPSKESTLKREELIASERDYGTLKDIPDTKKLKRDKSSKFKHKSLKRKESKKKPKNASEELCKLEDNKAFHGSDESFVTAHADSMSLMGEASLSLGAGIEGDTLGGDDSSSLPPDSPVFKFNPETMMVEIGSGQFDTELLEYPNLKGGGPGLAFVEDPFDIDDEEEDGKVTVPISICLIIIAGMYKLMSRLVSAVYLVWSIDCHL